MTAAPTKNADLYHTLHDEQGVVIFVKGRINHKTAGPLLVNLLNDLNNISSGSSFCLDMQDVVYFDDYGAMIIAELRDRCKSQNIDLKVRNLPADAQAILSLVDIDDPHHCEPIKPPRQPNLFVRLGEATLTSLNHIRYMVSFLGSVAICCWHVLLNPRMLRWGDVLTLMQKTGVDALPIVGLISFLLGLIMAFVSSLQLAQFGAEIYVASLVALSMVSELGPIMTAIVVAGRSGSAFAAEIGTMRISEEIDALFSMGFSPTLFLAIPRLLASMIVIPLLTLFSDLFAILGGLVISVSLLNLTPGSYINQTISALSLFEFVWGLAKSLVFATLIAWIGCLRGFQVRGGASAVGQAATSSVVTSIFMIILFDSIFAVIRSYW